MKYFDYPIGILLFNRPHLAKFLLRSLKESNLCLKEELVVFHVDGYKGSKFQEQCEKDRTGEVESLVRKNFPKSHIIKQDDNIGIAKSFYVIMDYVFQEFDSDIAVFQEEDVFLYPHYFETMEVGIQKIRELSWVGALSINNIDHYQNNRDDFVIPTYGTRELALKRQVFVDGKDIFDTYIQSLGPRYRFKELKNINLGLSKFGIELKEPNQDVFQHELVRYQNKLHLRINIPGSFQANLSSGESIPGLSIFDLVREFFKLQFSRVLLKEKTTSRYNFTSDLKVLEKAEFDYDLLMSYEERLWKAGISRPLGGKANRRNMVFQFTPSVEKLVIIRNKTGLSRIKYFLECLIISQKFDKFRK